MCSSEDGRLWVWDADDGETRVSGIYIADCIATLDYLDKYTNSLASRCNLIYYSKEHPPNF